MYFSSFPVIPYGSTDGTVKNVTNLLRRVAIRTKVKSNAALFDTYDIKNGSKINFIEHTKPNRK